MRSPRRSSERSPRTLHPGADPRTGSNSPVAVAAVRAWGLSLCARERQLESDTVSAIVVPEGFDAREVIRIAGECYDRSLGAGLVQLAGRVFRIGHLGDLDEVMCLGAIAGAE